MPNTKPNGKWAELKKLREHYGLSRRTISLILDCSEIQLYRWEMGRVENPHPDAARKLDFLLETLRKKEMKDGRRSNG